MKTGQRATVACASLVALIVLVASSPLGGLARSAAFVGIQPDSPALKHYALAGVALMPSGNSAVEYQQRHDGCFELFDYTITLFSPLVLPEGSIIKYVTMFYRDDDPLIATDVSGILRVNQQHPGADPTGENIVMLGSLDDGFNSVTSGELNHLVDMSSNFYQLKADLVHSSGNVWLCGFRIDYIPPSIFAIALPTIVKNHP
jgi:hypothetical protein